MKNIFMEIILAVLIFILFKVIKIIVDRIMGNLLKIDEQTCKKFDLFTSILLQLIFVVVWFMIIYGIIGDFELSDIECYISLCMIGISCVLWCYFSWDANKIFVMPRLAFSEERKYKKITVYILIFIFVLCQGYNQTLHVVDSSYEVNILFSITNYSVIVAAIALDRLMNQICS